MRCRADDPVRPRDPILRQRGIAVGQGGINLQSAANLPRRRSRLRFYWWGMDWPDYRSFWAFGMSLAPDVRESILDDPF
jgi:hypothetical protein